MFTFITPVIACGPTPVDIIFIFLIINFLLLIPVVFIERVILRISFKGKLNNTYKACYISNIISPFAILAVFFIMFLIAQIMPVISGFMVIGILFLPLIVVVWIKSAIYNKYIKVLSFKKRKTAVIISSAINYIIVLGTVYGILSATACRPREKARRISCTSNLKQIGLSLQQYAMDYNDFYPDKPGVRGLEQLRVNDYLTDYGVYNCPTTVSPKGQGTQKLDDEIVDYIYQNGYSDTTEADRSKIPLAWDKPENHEEYGNVLFLDGHVKVFTGANWMEQAGIKKD